MKEILTNAGELRDDIEPSPAYHNAPSVVVMDACAMARKVLDIINREK